ncbi:MAG: PQQ-dependent sugar dehydrogenase [Bacteroidetes bacterium]|nr:PQQ-dependent sugar dehydrogenase [Bacteroidota bacterium]
MIRLTALYIILFASWCFNHSIGQSLPTGFSHTLVTNNLNGPTNMAFAPDGRIFITGKSGEIRIVKNGLLLPTPFAVLNASYTGERGLLGIAFDPNFASNNYVYVHYTIPNGSNNRVSRLTANGDVMVPNSELIILNLDPLSNATNHNGGTIKFGTDGKLYIGAGENNNAAASQDLTSYLGKILRINTDGSAAQGNPFYTSSNSKKKRIWSYGLRNPFSFSFHPGFGTLFIQDVGSNLFEEINNGTLGGLNFGWPATEGPGTNSSYSYPLFSYANGMGATEGCALSGGTWFDAAISNFPSTYANKYFFIDYCNQYIKYINANGTGVTTFATGLPIESIILEQGPDGNLYYLSRSTNALYKISFAGISAPVINAQPVSTTAIGGQSATFMVTVTGTAPITYQWKKNGVNISNSNNSVLTLNNVTGANAGTYTCKVTNAYGTATSNGAVLTVLPYNAPPVATIISPASAATYTGGMTLTFSGDATDAETGTLPATVFQWEVVFHHAAHTHPGPSIAQQVKTGSITIPDAGEVATDVFYRLYLYVTDPAGLSDTAFVDILPQIVNLKFNTVPQGLKLRIDGQEIITPSTIPSVVGLKRQLTAITPQSDNGGNTFSFVNWNTATTPTLNITTPTTGKTYTATYTGIYRPADNPSNTVQGLVMEHYSGTWTDIPDFASILADDVGTVATISVATYLNTDFFAVQFSGYINVPSDGIYTFYTASDDGSNLYIGDALIVDNDGLHGMLEKSGTIGLQAGLHKISVGFLEYNGAENLIVSYAGPGINKQVVAASSLFRNADVVEIPVNGDAYIRSGTYANTALGNTDPLKLACRQATAANSNFQQTILKFDISGLNNPVDSALLVMHGALNQTTTSSLNIGAYKLSSNTWGQNTVTFNNAPTFGALLDQARVKGTNQKDYMWDVTAYVNEYISSGFSKIPIGISCLNKPGNVTAIFNSSESNTAIPKLIIISNQVVPNISQKNIAKHTSQSLQDMVQVFPNPATTTLHVKINAPYSQLQFELTDMRGSVVKTGRLYDHSLFSIDVSDVTKGIYYLKIYNSAFVKIEKVEVCCD